VVTGVQGPEAGQLVVVVTCTVRSAAPSPLMSHMRSAGQMVAETIPIDPPLLP
jgi:hypothetical protein